MTPMTKSVPIGLLVLLGLAAWAAAAPTTGPIEISLQAISLIKVKALGPPTTASRLPTSGIDLTLLLRTTDGRHIRSIGDVRIARAADDTGAAVPVAESVTRVLGGPARGGEMVVETVRATRKVEESVVRPKIPHVVQIRSEAVSAPAALATIPSKECSTTASITVHLGLASPNARALRRIEGKIALQLGEARAFTFKDIARLAGKPLDLGPQKNVALEIAQFAHGKVSLAGSGDPSRLGDPTFYDARGKPLSLASSSQSVSVVNGSGTKKMEYEFREAAGPIDMKVTVFGALESLDASFAFDNVELP